MKGGKGGGEGDGGGGGGGGRCVSLGQRTEVKGIRRH